MKEERYYTDQDDQVRIRTNNQNLNEFNKGLYNFMISNDIPHICTNTYELYMFIYLIFILYILYCIEYIAYINPGLTYYY